MKQTFFLERTCSHCGKLINDNNKSGFCRKCYVKYGKYGKNNPFYGKKHTKETIENIRNKCAKASKILWENDEYRNKVIEHCTGLKRSDEFKALQSKHAKEQFERDPYQRIIRSNKMKESWQNGAIVYTKNPSTNTSKQEHDLYLSLKEIYGDNCLDKQVIRYTTTKKHWLFPDILFPNKKLVVEFQGSFWHADPKRYNADDIIHHNVTAKEIWEANKNKFELYKSLGYIVYEIWSDDYKKNKQQVIDKFNEFYKTLC